MKLAGSTLIFSKKPFEEAVRCVAELGFSHVDLGMQEGWAHIDPSECVGRAGEVAARIERACRTHGVTPIAMNCSLDDIELERQAQRIDALSDLAHRLGVETITLNCGSTQIPLEKDLDRFHRLTPVASAHGITLTVETHFFCHTEDPGVALKYVAEVPDLKLTLDPSHYAVGPFWEQGFDELIPHVAFVHLRAAGRTWEEVQLPADQGVIDCAALVRRLQAEGYMGDYSVEYVDTMGELDHAHEARRIREQVEALT